MTTEDAVAAADHGAAGVVISNHGGRQLDTVPAGAEALPAVADAVGDRIDVLVDGGVPSRHRDALKALALGARAVMVGRPVIWGLAVGGGAARAVLEMLVTEFDVSLALAGVPSASELGPDSVEISGLAG